MVSGLSGDNLSVEDIYNHNSDLVAALRLYFSDANPEYAIIFAEEPPALVEAVCHDRLLEVDRNHSLSLLAALEAAFKVDYLIRCKLKLRDPVSRALRDIYKRKKERASLEDDILQVWKTRTTVPPRVIGDLIGAFNFRHWLAHGRYWPAKLGRKYDFFSVYALATLVLSSFPLESG